MTSFCLPSLSSRLSLLPAKICCRRLVSQRCLRSCIFLWAVCCRCPLVSQSYLPCWLLLWAPASLPCPSLVSFCMLYAAVSCCRVVSRSCSFTKYYPREILWGNNREPRDIKWLYWFVQKALKIYRKYENKGIYECAVIMPRACSGYGIPSSTSCSRETSAMFDILVRGTITQVCA